MATNNAINNLNFNNVTSVNTTAVLTASAYGTEVICTGSSAYTVTLPTVTSNANKFIDIYSQTTSNALVTISPASGTIAGQSTLIIGSGDGVRIMNDGTNWWVLNTWLQPVNFQATLSTNQTIGSGSNTTIAFDGTAFDIGSFFNTSTHVYAPLYPGKYWFGCYASFSPNTSATSNVVILQRNDGLQAQDSVALAANLSKALAATFIMSMNGSSNTMSGLVLQASGVNETLVSTPNSNITRLMGYRISLF